MNMTKKILLTELRSMIADEIAMMTCDRVHEEREYSQFDAGVEHDPDWVRSYPEDEGRWPQERDDVPAADALEPDELDELEATTGLSAERFVLDSEESSAAGAPVVRSLDDESTWILDLSVGIWDEY